MCDIVKHIIDEDLLDTAVHKGFNDEIHSFWNCAQLVSASNRGLHLVDCG